MGIGICLIGTRDLDGTDVLHALIKLMEMESHIVIICDAKMGFDNPRIDFEKERLVNPIDGEILGELVEVRRCSIVDSLEFEINNLKFENNQRIESEELLLNELFLNVSKKFFPNALTYGRVVKAREHLFKNSKRRNYYYRRCLSK